MKNKISTQTVLWIAGVIIVFAVTLWLGGVFGKSPIAGQKGPVDRDKLVENVTKLLDDWEASCPMGRLSYGGPGTTYMEFPDCQEPFDTSKYDQTTLVAMGIAFGPLKNSFYESPRAPPANIPWNQVKSSILHTVYTYSK